MVVAPCLAVKSHSDRSLVTEPSVCTMRSCGLLFLCLFCFFGFLFRMRSSISDYVLLAGHSRGCFPKGSGKSVILITETRKSKQNILCRTVSN